MRARRMNPIALVALLWWALAPSSQAAAETQRIAFPAAPAWYFVALQVEPAPASPLAVFPSNGEFSYDHLWSYDPVDGWRYFSPAAAGLPLGAAGPLNDLQTIEALRGYWIHVTRVPPGGFELVVDGDVPSVQRLRGANWHAIGALTAPDAPAADASRIFSDLGPSLGDDLLEIWRYESTSDRFAPIDELVADCGATPLQCLAPGSGYWLRTAGDVLIGQEFALAPERVLITGDAPLQPVEIRYTGVVPAVGVLRASPGDAGLAFRAASSALIDSDRIPVPADRDASADGPEQALDLDGNGTPETPCPDACAGDPGCVNLCFQDGTRSHFVFASLEDEQLFALEDFSGLDPGRELLQLELSQAALPLVGGLQARNGAALGEVLAAAAVAVKPPVVSGEYVALLSYGEDGGSGSVALSLLLDECARTSDGSVGSCGAGRVSAVVNPTIRTSALNGIDDDGDGHIDEPDEGEAGRTVVLRDGPGLPNDTILRGSLSSDNQILRLRSEPRTLPDLGFAATGQCVNGQCEDGSGACEQDGDCPRNAGLARLFSNSERLLEFEARRSGPETFEGFFVDRYADEGALGGLASSGRAVLRRVRAPRCIAPGDETVPTLDLDVPCRRDADCPSRCVGAVELEGFSCVSDADCSFELEGGASVSGTCEPYACSFATPGGASADAFDQGAAQIDISAFTFPDGQGQPGEIGQLAVEVLGLPNGVAIAERAGRLSLGDLPCGSYDVRVSAAHCGVASTTLDVCSGSTPPSVILTCVGPARQADSQPAFLSGIGTSGEIRLSAAPILTGPEVTLRTPTGGACTPGPGVTCLSWYLDGAGAPLPVALRGGVPSDELTLIGLGGELAVAGVNPFTDWTALLSWPPTELRAGVLAVVEPAASGGI